MRWNCKSVGTNGIKMLIAIFVVLISASHGHGQVVDNQTMKEVRDMFPYCRIGEDKQGAGVYIAPYAAWKHGELGTNGTPAQKKAYELFIEEMIKGFREDSGRNLEGAIFILDCQGLDIAGLISPGALLNAMKLLAKNREFARVVKKFVVINIGVSAQVFSLIWHPLLGDLLPRTQVYGPKPQEWIPALQKIVPKDVLPQGYGGYNLMPDRCNREEMRRPYKYPTPEIISSAINIIALNPLPKLSEAAAGSFSRAIGNAQSAFQDLFG